MSIQVRCECGRELQARDEFAGTRAQCPDCGRVLTIPARQTVVPLTRETEPAHVGIGAGAEATAGGKTGSQRAAWAAGAAGKFEEPIEIREFLDPPTAPVAAKRQASLWPMIEALLDPRSIHWMLMLGGGLTVLGLVVWLTSLGIFENKVVLAVALGGATLAVLGAGWSVTLGTRFKTAGRALTFLGCVLLPLNLWFYHAQGLITLENRLWIGGVICCLLYLATVYVLRDPLFVYAVEAGATLTVLLFLAELQLVADTSYLCVALMVLGLGSIHAERAFPAGEGIFTRKRFGMPLFWCGQAQIAAALLLLLGTQAAGWLLAPERGFFAWDWPGNPLSNFPLLAGGLWLAGTYCYLYSDLVVRRVGVYMYLAAVSLVMAEVTLVRRLLDTEGLIAALALTALAANIVYSRFRGTDEKVERIIPPLALGLSGLPLLMGLVLHIRATSEAATTFDWTYASGWSYVVVMLVVAVANRLSAYLCGRADPRSSSVYFFFSAGALIVAAAGLLRTLGMTVWHDQAPWLMLIPIGYLIASRMWRGHSSERPLAMVAQTATAVILLHVLIGSMEVIGRVVQPVEGQSGNLQLGLVFAEAAVFYGLAALFHRSGTYVYFAAAAACGAVWQGMAYWAVPGPYHTMFYALVGLAFLIVGRRLGLQLVDVYRTTGQRGLAVQGRGLAAFQSGNAVLLVAVLSALWQGVMRLHLDNVEWPRITATSLLVVVSLLAAAISPRGAWQRIYVTWATVLGGLLFLTLTLQLDLTVWQKLKIVSTAIGVLMIAASYVAYFRQAVPSRDQTSFGLWTGSLLACGPLLVAVVYHRFEASGLSLADEVALLTVSVAMLFTGVSWRFKSTTLVGGAAFAIYLIVLLVALGWQQQLAVGVYLAIGGGIVFALGIALSMYRERLLELPERIANREGIFRIMNWR